MNRFIPREKARQVLLKIQELNLPFTYDSEKHRLIITDEKGNEIIYFRVPLVLPPPAQNLIFEFHKPVNYIILLIQSGNCALGYFENGNNLNHKVFRAYMVRMKQGKSQVKYLKTKGKSRAGSRVRLGETVEFFQDINERLQEYFASYPINRIALSCSKILIPYLFNAKISTPFDKRDPRILFIPKHIHTPNYEILLDTNKFLLKGELIFEEAHQHLAHSLLGEPLENIIESS